MNPSQHQQPSPEAQTGISYPGLLICGKFSSFKWKSVEEKGCQQGLNNAWTKTFWVERTACRIKVHGNLVPLLNQSNKVVGLGQVWKRIPRCPAHIDWLHKLWVIPIKYSRTMSAMWRTWLYSWTWTFYNEMLTTDHRLGWAISKWINEDVKAATSNLSFFMSKKLHMLWP